MYSKATLENRYEEAVAALRPSVEDMEAALASDDEDKENRRVRQKGANGWGEGDPGYRHILSCPRQAWAHALRHAPCPSAGSAAPH